MLCLAVDTATSVCSACLYDAGTRQVLSQRVEEVGRRHAELLLPMIEDCLREADRDYLQLDRLGVCVGPGSFTGLRVGVAAMRGLALALDLPNIGVSMFDGLARSARAERPLLVALDARRGEIYCQLYAAVERADWGPGILTPAEAAKIANRHGALLTGSGGPLIAEHDASLSVLDARSHARIGDLAELAAGRPVNEPPPAPLYLRAPDAKPQLGFALPRRGVAT